MIFLFFIFSSSTTPAICRYCPFICHTIAQIAFYVQLVVRGNFNRLNRKYECFCVLFENVCLWSIPVCLFGLEIKNLKLFPDFVWWLGRRLLTLHAEIKNELSYERKH